MQPTTTLSPPGPGAAPLAGAGCLEAEPANLLAELRRIAEAQRSLTPRFRGLRVATTPTDSDLVLFTSTMEELGIQALAEAAALLRVLERAAFPEALEDLGNLVAAEISGHSHLLRQSLAKPGVPLWEKGSLALGLSSKSLKAAIAVENAYCELLGCERLLSLQSEIEDALAVRQAYCKLWSSLPAITPADPAKVESGLRRGSAAIAGLVGHEIFLELRYHDRRLILAMQRRIRNWLAGGGATEAGQPLLQDLSNLFVLLSQINNRIELLMHDEALVKSLLARLRAADPPWPLQDAELRRAILPLLGRDGELDRLLLGRIWETPGAELRRILNVMALRWNKPPRETPAAPFNDAGQIQHEPHPGS